MEIENVILALAALAQSTRLEVFRLLVKHEPDGLPAGDIADQLAVKQNTMSTHLAVLSRAGLIHAKRESRSIYYRADLDALRAVTVFLMKDCCGGRPDVCAPSSPNSPPAARRSSPVTDRPYNVLFLCTGNTARSILAEAVLRVEGAGRFNVYSAGSQPKGVVNPFALKVLEAADYPTEGLRSKSWDEFAGGDAPVMDFIITVCDNAAGEACPFWPGKPATAHWGIEDPAAVEGTDLDKERAFVAALRYLKNRVTLFTSLPLASLDEMAVTNRLRAIGLIEGATRKHEDVA